jgi:hypothetical protein
MPKRPSPPPKYAQNPYLPEIENELEKIKTLPRRKVRVRPNVEAKVSLTELHEAAQNIIPPSS